MVTRRTVLVMLGSLTALPTFAQQAKTYHIGWISPNGGSYNGPAFEAFKEGMRKLGYSEARNMRIDLNWADGSDEKLAQMARAERVNDFATPRIINLLCKVVVVGECLSPFSVD